MDVGDVSVDNFFRFRSTVLVKVDVSFFSVGNKRNFNFAQSHRGFDGDSIGTVGVRCSFRAEGILLKSDGERELDLFREQRINICRNFFSSDQF